MIERVSANAFKLDLGVSVSSKTIDVFHVKYLRPTIDGPYRPSVTLQPLPVTEDDDEPEYEIDRRPVTLVRLVSQAAAHPLL